MMGWRRRVSEMVIMIMVLYLDTVMQGREISRRNLLKMTQDATPDKLEEGMKQRCDMRKIVCCKETKNTREQLVTLNNHPLNIACL